jgi:nuclear pore complex protein Nup62
LQLQWIDQNAELLQQKVTAAQKLGQGIGSNGLGGLGGQESDAADAFYRSLMSRR